MSDDFHLEYDDPARPLKRFIPALYLNRDVAAIMREHALPDECVAWIEVGADPHDFARLGHVIHGENLDGFRDDEVFVPSSTEMDEGFLRAPTAPNYGAEPPAHLHRVEIEVDVVCRERTPIRPWLEHGEWPDPEQFLFCPDGWDWTEEDCRSYPLKATYARGAAVVEFDAECPRFAPGHSPDYFEKLVYCRGLIELELPVIPDVRRIAEWRYIITPDHESRLVIPEGEFRAGWTTLYERRDAYVYWAGREIAYGDMDHRF